MKRLHWFDQKEAEEKVQRQKARMEKEEIRRNVRIEEETERIREETIQRKSDSCSSINPFSFKHTA